MNREEVRAFTHELFEDVVRGDIHNLGAKLDDDIDWIFHAPVAIFPCAGALRGRRAVLASMMDLARDYQIERQVLETVVADKDRSAALTDVALTQRATGRMVRLRVAHIHRFRDGKLVEYRGFTDSFDATEQVLGRWLDLAPPPQA